MKTSNLVDLPRCTPLSVVVENPSREAFLSPSVYKIGDGVYLRLSPFRAGSLEKDASGPFVTGIAWAPGAGAVRRALLMEIESDDGATSSIPDDFLPAPDASTYGSILSALRDGAPRVCQETAEYRIASDGRFIHRTIETERFSFHFRNSEHDDSERPYVVVVKLA